MGWALTITAQKSNVNLLGSLIFRPEITESYILSCDNINRFVTSASVNNATDILRHLKDPVPLFFFTNILFK